MDDKKIVAAFDFDGTITYRDSLLPFLVFSYGYFVTALKLFFKSPTLIGFVMRFVERQQAKEAILSAFFKGKSIVEINRLAEKYATEKLKDLIRPEAKARIEWHQKQGHECVLISASIDSYLSPWAKAAGFKKVISSSLEISSQGLATGKLNGSNCWGPEKVRRLEEVCGRCENYTLYAYGDSRGDKELLAVADHSYFKSMGGSE